MDWKRKRIRAILETALIEDKAAYDVTTALTVDPKLRATATIVAKQPLVVAGLGCIPVFLEIFGELAAKAHGASNPLGRFEVISHAEVFDGVRVKKGQPIAVIRSKAAALLSTERVILNLMQRMSGIATLTSEYVQAVKGTNAKVLDTRKTIPGLRALDKYAVCCGGGVNHRLDLEDGILIKNNHIALGGGLAKVLAAAKKKRRARQSVQVEVRSQQELDEAIAGKPDSILLDNMTPAQVQKALKQIRAALPEIPVEASGNMNLETVRKYALTGVDLISVGALTHSAVAVDLSMKIVANGS
jgi:nicotinate-nucleotide pyrophosphorylase (carboxylating)